MKKNFIVTKEQLNEYMKRKKAQKVFFSILEDMQKNSKNLNEQISIDKANKSIIYKYKNNNKINEHVQKLLKEYSLIDENENLI